MYTRYLEDQIKTSLLEGLVVVVYGARQVGKTTLAKKIMTDYRNPLYINADEITERLRLQNKSSLELKDFFGRTDMVIIDEAQRVENIGLTAKIVHDTYPEIKILLTGSSSLDLATKIKEPLTGRSVEFNLYPLSLDEVAFNNAEKESAMKRALVYGSYPAMWTMSPNQSIERLRLLATNYISGYL